MRSVTSTMSGLESKLPSCEGGNRVADTGEDLRTYLLADSSVAAIIGTRCYEGEVDESATLPFVWLRRRGVEYLGILGEVEGVPYREWFDCECVADGVDAALDLADAARARLQGTSGTLGSTVYQWVAVTDQEDDYIPRQQAADERLTIASLNLEIINQ